MKITGKITEDRFEIQLSQEDNDYILWVHNKSINEHVSIKLTTQELAQFVGIATTLL